MTALSTVTPMAGSGLVARAGDLLLVVADQPGADQVLQVFAAAAAEGVDGNTLVRRVAALLATDEDGQLPACAVGGPVQQRFAVLVWGAATAEVAGADGPVRLSGADAITAVSRFVPGPVTTVRLLLPGAGATVDGRLHLAGGVIAGAGLVASDTGSPSIDAAPAADAALAQSPDDVEVPAEPADAAEPEVAGEPEAEEPSPASDPVPAPAQPVAPVAPLAPFGAAVPAQQPVAAAVPHVEYSVVPPAGPYPAPPPFPPAEGPAPVQPEAPRPLVLGVFCKNDHFNDPELRYCQVCGIAMQPDLVPQEGPRPPLGVLLFDDGMTLPLDVDYLLGREPGQDPSVVAGQARPLRVVDPQNQVSRVHLRVALVGWGVHLVDLSANGTYLRQPGEETPVRVAKGESVPLKPGAQIHLGQRWLRYESHRNP
jgi:FHA domain